MLVHIWWLSSLLPIASSSSTIYSTNITSISTIIKPTLKSNSTHQTSPFSTKSSSTTPTSIPQTFYIVTDVDDPGAYFKLVPNPYPANPLNSDKALQAGYKNSTGAANFTLNDDGTLQCNSDSGPLYASLPGYEVTDLTWEFEDPSELDRWGLVALTCSIGDANLLCQLGGLRVPYLGDDGILGMGAVGVPLFVLLLVVPT